MKEADGFIPSYTVRVSGKARRVILRMLPGQKLEVVVPRNFDQKKVPEIIRNKRNWIEKTLQRMEFDDKAGEVSSFPPDSIYFKAVDSFFSVRCISKNSGRIQLIQTDDRQLELIGELSMHEPCRMLLKQWLRFQGMRHLIPLLEQLSAGTGLHYGKAQIRGQKSRWGSCSSTGTISLSYKLLFLPPELVRYVMIHELCHTMLMNHSRQFWSLVASFEPSCKVSDTAMNSAWKHVPVWAN